MEVASLRRSEAAFGLGRASRHEAVTNLRVGRLVSLARDEG